MTGSGFVFPPQVTMAGRNYQAWANSGNLQKDERNARAAVPDASIVLRQHPVASGKVEFEVQA